MPSVFSPISNLCIDFKKHLHQNWLQGYLYKYIFHWTLQLVILIFLLMIKKFPSDFEMWGYPYM